MATIVETFTANPSSYDTTDYAYYGFNYPSRGYASETSSTAANIQCTRGSVGAVTYVYYKFNTSSIPQDVTIRSVEIKARATSGTNSNNNLRVRQMQAFSGTTAKGNAFTLATNSTAQTLNIGDWTRAELDDVRIRLYAERGTSNLNTNYNLNFYGATLTIVYSYNDGQGQDIFCKQNGSWVSVDSVYVKQNGVWVQTDTLYIKDNGTWKS